MPGSSGSPTRRGPNWRRSFRKSRAGRYAASPRPLPILGAPSAGNAGPWAVFNSAIGPVYGLRGYNTPAQGVPAAWPGPGTGVIPAQVPPSGQVVSFHPDIAQVLAGTLDAALAAYFATVPAGAYVSAWHEGEIDGAAAGFTQAQLIAMHTRLYGIFQANAPAAASYGQIVSTASSFAGNAGYPLGPWTCSSANGGANLDFYGMDIQPSSTTTTFADEISRTTAAMTAAGVADAGPWTIAEVSSTSTWRSSQSQWLSDGWNAAQAIGALHYLVYFNNNLPDAQQHWPPASVDTLRVLQDIAAVSRGDPRPAAAAVPARSTTAAIVSSASSAGLTATFTSNPAAGSKVLAVIQAGFAAGLTVTDNGTTPATFRLDAACMNVSGKPSVFLYRADNITLPGAGTYAVTVARSPSGSLQVAAAAYGGVQNGPPSATSGIIGTSSANPAVSPVTPADISSLFYSAFFANSAQNPESITVASPEFALGQTQVNGTSLFTGAVADALVTTPAARAGGWTLSDAPADFSAVMAAYAAFPATITLVPGAQAAWAQAPDPGTGISVNAGLASASGAAKPAAIPPFTAGLASASGWAAVNAPFTGNVPAGLAAASGAAATATASVTVTAGLASGSGAAPFTPAGGTVSDTLTAINPVGAAGAALDVIVATDVTAGLASSTGAAPGAAVTISATPAPAPAAGAAPGAAAAAGATGNAGLASATGAALSPVITEAAAAGLAAAAGVPPALTAPVLPAAALAAAAGAALQTAGHTAGLAAAPGAALQAGGQNAAPAPAAGTSQPPVAAVTVTAGLASGSGAAAAAVASGNPAAGLASASGAALQTSGQNTGLAAATGSALQATVTTGGNIPAGLAAAAGSAAPAAPAITVTAGLAPASGTAQPAGHGAGAGPAAASAAAGQAAAGVPGRNAPAGLPATTGAALAPSLTTLAAAAAAQALAAALNPAAATAAAFTVGTLTASDRPAAVLASAAATTPQSTLTASDTRTGGPGG